jgi:hypothetical protein
MASYFIEFGVMQLQSELEEKKRRKEEKKRAKKEKEKKDKKMKKEGKKRAADDDERLRRSEVRERSVSERESEPAAASGHHKRRKDELKDDADTADGYEAERRSHQPKKYGLVNGADASSSRLYLGPKRELIEKAEVNERMKKEENDRKRRRTGPLTEEERERRIRQMQEDAEVHDVSLRSCYLCIQLYSLEILM